MAQIETLQNPAYGPGEGGDERSGWGGYMPDGEDGLMTLADFGRDHGWGDPNPGNQPDGGPGGPDGVGSGGPHGGGPISSGGGFTGGGPGGGPGGKPGDNGNNGGVGGNGGTSGPGDPGGPGGPWTDDGGGKPCYWYCDGPPRGDPPSFVPDPGPQGPADDPPITSAVPEPATWIMLILGFGALGSVLRAQRRRAGQLTA